MDFQRIGAGFQLLVGQLMWRAECFCNLNSLPDSCQKKKKKNPPRETTEGFKESREAAINVIPTLGFSVNEMGDHIPILKLIPITLSCVFFFFSTFSQKKERHHL